MNIQSMMAQAKKMQRDLEEKQTEINNTEYVGETEWVKVTLKGDFSLKEIVLKQETNEKEVLEDMLLIAYNEAYNKIKKDTEEKMGSFSNMGGLF